jgi:tellurite resistance protein TehA-like permease
LKKEPTKENGVNAYQKHLDFLTISCMNMMLLCNAGAKENQEMFRLCVLIMVVTVSAMVLFSRWSKLIPSIKALQNHTLLIMLTPPIALSVPRKTLKTSMSRQELINNAGVMKNKSK